MNWQFLACDSTIHPSIEIERDLCRPLRGLRPLLGNFLGFPPQALCYRPDEAGLRLS